MRLPESSLFITLSEAADDMNWQLLKIWGCKSDLKEPRRGFLFAGDSYAATFGQAALPVGANLCLVYVYASHNSMTTKVM